MPKRNRITLKESFRKGKKPTAQDFENLIDSMINMLDDGLSKQPETGIGLAPIDGNHTVLSVYRTPGDEEPLWEFAVNDQNGALEIGRQAEEAWTAYCSLHPDGDITIGHGTGEIILAGQLHNSARKGTFCYGKVPADGKWHDITGELEGCWALEVAAGCGRRHTGRYALTVSTAVHCFGKHNRIKKTGSWYGIWGNRLRIRWVTNGFKARLQVKTVYGYGGGTMIRYHITRLWDDPFMVNE